MTFTAAETVIIGKMAEDQYTTAGLWGRNELRQA